LCAATKFRTSFGFVFKEKRKVRFSLILKSDYEKYKKIFVPSVCICVSKSTGMMSKFVNK